MKGQPPPKKTPTEEDKEVESSLENAWTEVWILKIIIIQTTFRKA